MEDVGAQQNQVTRLTLDLRGSRFTIEQEMLMNLPESVLLCLFPNGLVLSRQPTSGYNDGGEGGEEGMANADDDEEEVYIVDVSVFALHKNTTPADASLSPSSLTPLVCRMSSPSLNLHKKVSMDYPASHLEEQF